MERIVNQADENFLIEEPVAQRLASKMAMRKYLKGRSRMKGGERERGREQEWKKVINS